MKIHAGFLRRAQTVFGNLPGARQFAVVLLVSGVVAGGVAVAAWIAAEYSKFPLPLEYVGCPAAGELLGRLKARDIGSAEYDSGAGRVLVARKDEKKAVIALAEDGLLGEAHAYGFGDMLERWVLSNGTRLISDESLRLARADGAARLIALLDNIAEARVVYYRDPIVCTAFGHRRRRTIASVGVKTGPGGRLEEKTVNTIAAIITAANPLVDPRDVIITDQGGRRFSSKIGNTADERKRDAEFDIIEQHRRRLESLAYSYCMENSRRDFSGLNENGGAVIASIGHGADFGEFSSPEDGAPDPRITDMTVLLIIQLPSRLKRDGENRMLREIDGHGDAVSGAGTGLPVWKRESVDPLPADRIGELKRRIAHASGISLADISEKIEIEQVSWNASMLSPKDGGSLASAALRWISEHRTHAATFIWTYLAVFAFCFAVSVITISKRRHCPRPRMKMPA